MARNTQFLKLFCSIEEKMCYIPDIIDSVKIYAGFLP